MEKHLLAISRNPLVPSSRSGWLLVWNSQADVFARRSDIGGPIPLPVRPSDSAVDKDTGITSDEAEEAGWQWRFCRLKSNVLFFHHDADSPPGSCALVEVAHLEQLSVTEALGRWEGDLPPPPDEVLSAAAKAMREREELELDEEAEHALMLDLDSNTMVETRDAGRAPMILKMTFGLDEPSEPLASSTSADRRDPPLYLLSISRSGASQWHAALKDCTTISLNRKLDRALTHGGERGRSTDQGGEGLHDVLALREAQISELHASIEVAQNTITGLRSQVEEHTEVNARLQYAAEVTEKASSEMIEQKVWEVGSLQRQTAAALDELGQTVNKLQEVRERYDNLQAELRRKTVECAKLSDRLREIEVEMEENQEAPGRTLKKLSFLRTENQRLLDENRRLRREAEGSAENLHNLESDFRQRLQLVKDVMESSEVFELLRKLLLLAEHRCKYIEEAFSLPQDEAKSLKERIIELQGEVRISETAARSQHIRHRSEILSEQLAALGGGKKRSGGRYGEYFVFAKVSLDRHGWLFGDHFVSDATDKEAGDKDATEPWYSESLKVLSTVCFRERNFFTSGVEGGHCAPRLLDLMKPPEKFVPATDFHRLSVDKQKAENRCNFYREQWREAKEEIASLRAAYERFSVIGNVWQKDDEMVLRRRTAI